MQLTQEERIEKRKRERARLDAIHQTIKISIEKLLRCPFCGDIPIIDVEDWGSEKRQPAFFIACNCFKPTEDYWSKAEIRTRSFRDINLAIEMWNTRKHQDARQDEEEKPASI